MMLIQAFIARRIICVVDHAYTVQIFRKTKITYASMKRMLHVFILTIIMVLGESGLGKSTLIDSLFLTDLYLNRKIPRVSGEFLILSYTVVHVQ